jgi:hypothetical protein
MLAPSGLRLAAFEPRAVVCRKEVEGAGGEREAREYGLFMATAVKGV